VSNAFNQPPLNIRFSLHTFNATQDFAPLVIRGLK
jgi:hypothetical protein